MTLEIRQKVRELRGEIRVGNISVQDAVEKIVDILADVYELDPPACNMVDGRPDPDDPRGARRLAWEQKYGEQG